MREIRLSGSEGGGAETNRPSLPLYITVSLRDAPVLADRLMTFGHFTNDQGADPKRP